MKKKILHIKLFIWIQLLVLNGATADKIYEAVTSNENYAASGLKIKKTDTMQNALKIAKNI